MPVHSDDTEYQTVGVDATDLRRYTTVDLDNGAVVLFDQEIEDAWIQTDHILDLESTT